VSPAGLGQRLSVFAVFAALAAAAAVALQPGVPAGAPTSAELAELETKMTAGARLHPVAVVPAPAGPALWCAECHPGLPHPGAGVDRAMLNEHAGRMDCLLCHWPAAGGSRPVPTWQIQAGATAYLGVLPRERSSKEQLSALRSAAMTGRRCFERGPGCAGCHRPGAIGALLRPGSAPGSAAALEHLGNHFTLAPGEKWYFPRIQ
jgi:hypothetical protein